jgi:hypothetical protein
MDSRDFRKKWLNLQESWTEEANVNVNATKAEKLTEKRKLPDALKAHQFGKKKDAAEETDKKDAKGPEKAKKEDKKEDKKDDKKPSFLKKKATEGKKPTAGWTHAHAKQRVIDAEKKRRDAEKNAAKKVKEQDAGGATTSAAVGGAKGTCPDAHIGAPERLKKRNESQLFSHFKKFMAEAGLPVGMEDPAAVPGQDVAGDAVAELTGEEPVGEPGLDAPADDAASVLADIQDRFPGKKIRICVEADPTEPFSTEDVAAAEAAIAAVPEEVEGLEGDEGAEEMLAPEAGGEMPVDQDIADEVRVESMNEESNEQIIRDIWDHFTQAGRTPKQIRNIIATMDSADIGALHSEIKAGKNVAESFSVREDEEEDMGAADGVEEVPTGDELDAEGGEEIGAEVEVEGGSEASPEALSMTPEQWTEFLAGAGEEGLGDELAGATDVADAGEGDDSDSESNKSQDTLG